MPPHLVSGSYSKQQHHFALGAARFQVAVRGLHLGKGVGLHGQLELAGLLVAKQLARVFRKLGCLCGGRVASYEYQGRQRLGVKG